MSREKYLANR